jgi:hypothetical protein
MPSILMKKQKSPLFAVIVVCVPGTARMIAF